MAPNLNLVPDIKSKVLLILAVLVLATIGLFERRDKITLNDGTVITGKVLTENDASISLERPSLYVVEIPKADVASRTWFNVEVDLQLGLDLRGGTALRYALDLDKFPSEQRSDIHDRTVQTFQSRLDNLGVKELSVYKSGDDEVIVELPGITKEESDSYENVIESLGSLRFAIKAQSRSGVLDYPAEEQRLRDHLKSLTDGGTPWTRKSVDLSQFDVQGAPGVVFRWLPYSEKYLEDNSGYGLDEFPFMMLELNDAEMFTGDDIESTFPDIDQSGFAAMGFSMKGSRAAAFGKFTEAHLQQQMAIVLDDEIASAPNLDGRISDKGVITGGATGFSNDELTHLNTVLASGTLRVSPTQLSKMNIGPSLGEESISRGVLAGIIAGVLVLGFIAFYYMSTGLIAGVALMVGMYLLIGGLGFLDATLTLPGIAGILLTVGMAVDQNILINERIREEREKGKTLAQSVKNGFERAFITIVDAQATTFIAGFILFKFGTGPIRGFAVTLMLGILTTMFASLVAGKTVFAIALEREWFKSLHMRKLIGNTEFQFNKYLRVCGIGSGIALLLSAVLFAIDYEDLKGTDFAGGFQAHVRLKDPINPTEMRNLVETAYPSAQIVSMIGSDGSRSDGDATTDYQIKIRASASDDDSGEGEQTKYEVNLRNALAGKMLPDAIDVQPSGITAAADGRASVGFGLNFTAPVATSVLENRLRERISLTSVTPVGEAPAASFQVQASFPDAEITPDGVKSEVSAVLANLPNGAVLLDPIPESAFISGKVGKELRDSAIKAIFLAIIAILIYIRVRFHDVNYGIAACVAVAHDVLFCLGMATLAHRIGFVNIELDLAMVGAFLTIIGYSLNDTIVIFDRVRENLPRMNKPLAEVLDASINQTLARTILTSATTLISVVVLFLLNYGQRNVLEGFAFVMATGVLVGTYSTIYIASPLLVWLQDRDAAKKLAAAKAA